MSEEETDMGNNHTTIPTAEDIDASFKNTFEGNNMEDPDTAVADGAAPAVADGAAPPNEIPETAPPKAVPADSNNSSINKTAGPKGAGGPNLQFPFKLHEMLKMADRNDKSHIVSWMPEGRGFKVHNKEAFCEHIMPLYFSSNKYKTFQRSLNLWGFESVSKGPNRGACYHEFFIKDRPDLCHSMNRIKVKGKGTRSGSGNKQQQMVDATFPPQVQQQNGNIASFIRGNNKNGGMPDPATAMALAAAANPQLAMMNAAMMGMNPAMMNAAMMGFHPAAAMMGMNPAMMNAALLMQQQQQQQQQQQFMMSQQQQQNMNNIANANSNYAMQQQQQQPTPAVSNGPAAGGGGTTLSSTAEV